MIEAPWLHERIDSSIDDVRELDDGYNRILAVSHQPNVGSLTAEFGREQWGARTAVAFLFEADA